MGGNWDTGQRVRAIAGAVVLSVAGLASLTVGAAPAGSVDGANGGGTFTATTSTTRHTTVTRVDLPAVTVVVVGGQATEISGPADGPEVAALLAGQGGAVLEVTTTEEFLGEVLTYTETSTTTSTSLGPATILIGEDQSETYFVPAGTTNVNTNTHTEYFLDARYRRVTTITVEPAAVSPRFTG